MSGVKNCGNKKIFFDNRSVCFLTCKFFIYKNMEGMAKRFHLNNRLRSIKEELVIFDIDAAKQQITLCPRKALKLPSEKQYMYPFISSVDCKTSTP